MLKLHVQKEYFTAIKEGKKIFEGRLAKEKYRQLSLGDKIEFYDGEDTVIKNITSIHIFDSFGNGGNFLGVSNITPGVSSVKELISLYRKFYSEMDEQKYGAIFIGLQ